jgi:hypothetical protein
MPVIIVGNGERHPFSFATLEERFTGVRSAIWSFWQSRKRGRVDAIRVREFMQCYGHSSFLARCMWHLLPENNEATLIAARRRRISQQCSTSVLSRGQVVYLARPDSTAVVKGSSTSDVLLLLKTELMMVTEVEDEGWLILRKSCTQ